MDLSINAAATRSPSQSPPQRTSTGIVPASNTAHVAPEGHHVAQLNPLLETGTSHDRRITRKESTESLRLAEGGRQGPATPDDMLAWTHALFEGRPEAERAPGGLERAFRTLDADALQHPVRRRLAAAYLTSDVADGRDEITPRDLFEDGVVANWDGHLQHNLHALVHLNGLVPSMAQQQDNAVRAIDVMLRNQLIRRGETVLIVGTGYGFEARHLSSQGFDVIAIEPDTTLPSYFEGTLPLTLRQFREIHRDCRVDVAYFGNFNLDSIDRPDYLKDREELISDLKATVNRGFIMGISGMDPYLLSPGSERELLPDLPDSRFSARILRPHELGEPFSIGGQMALAEVSRVPWLR